MEHSLLISASEIPEEDLELPIRGAEPHCSIFTLEYEKAYRQVQNTNPLLGRTYQTLAILTSFWPNFDSPAEPYGPTSRFGETRSLVPDDLTEDDLGVLPVLLEKLTEPALRARILDVLWIRRKDFKAALQAVKAYIMAAEKLFETEAWVYGVECLRRAFQLATSLGRGKDAYQKTETAFEKILGKPIENIHLNFANHLLGLAAEFHLSDPAKFAAIAAGHGEACLRAGEFEFARQYDKLAAGFFNRAGDQQLTKTQMLRVADLFEEEADNLLKGETARAMAAVTFLKQALEINRQFKAEQAKIESVREKLRQAQTVSLDHFQEFRFETNIADLQQKAETEVSGMEFEKAILCLALLPN
jgi:tetratricopeptide (TPR) repeat protein